MSHQSATTTTTTMQPAASSSRPNSGDVNTSANDGGNGDGKEQGPGNRPRRRRRSRRSEDPSRPQPPKCIAACIASIEDCADNMQECSDNIEARQLANAKRRAGHDPTWTGRGNRPDPQWKQKGIIPLVAVILSWVYIVYTWRLCAPAIRQSTSPDAHPVRLASRSAGIGLLVGFNILWLVTIWAYVKAVATGPGFAKDHVDMQEPPQSLQQTWMQNGQGGPYLGPSQGEAAGEGDEVKQQSDSVSPSSHNRNASTVALPGDAGGNADEDADADADVDAIDPTLPAVIGPLGAGAIAAQGEETRMVQESQRRRRQQQQQQQQQDREDVGGGRHKQIDQPTIALDPEDHDQSGGHPAPHSDANAAAEAEADATPADQTRTIAPAAPPLPVSPGPTTDKAPLTPPTRLPPYPEYAPLAMYNRYCHRCSHIKPPRSHHCRHCGTCVLKMDHHCPWVGGCVGARNHKFFFHFVFWVTMLEFYVLVSVAVLFSRGALQRDGYGQWTLDGFVISLFPVCTIFILFTFSLLVTHAYLLLTNLSTLDHLAFQRTNRREEVALSEYFSQKKKRTAHDKSLSARQRRTAGSNDFAEKRKMKKSWDRQFGKLKSEINLWKVEERVDRATEDKGEWRKLSSREAMLANWKQSMGDRWWMWVLPIGKSSNDGLDYPLNPRHGPLGEWRPRDQWPKELQ